MAEHFNFKILFTPIIPYLSDFEAKKNPFQELGGFMPVFMGYGIPGTGKSSFTKAIAQKYNL